MGRLLTAQQVVEEFNLPSARTVRTLQMQGLPTVKLGAARLIDYDDMVAFIEARKEASCPAQTQVRASSHRASVRSTTSSGMPAGGNAFDQLALQTADKLKRLSRSSSETTSEEPGRVIRGTFR